MKNDQPVLILLHYFGGSAQSWKYLLEYLQKDFECLPMRLPGFGGEKPLPLPSVEKYSEYVQNEISNRGISTCVLIGHSMGAKIAIHAASKMDKNQMEAVFLIAPSPPTVEPKSKTEVEKMLRIRTEETAEDSVNSSIVGELQKDRYQLAVSTQFEADRKTWKWWILEGMNHSIADKINPLLKPVIVIASQDDPVISPRTIKNNVLQILPEAKVVWTKNTGHLIPLEKPRWLAQEIISHLMSPSNIVKTKNLYKNE